MVTDKSKNPTADLMKKLKDIDSSKNIYKESTTKKSASFKDYLNTKKTK